MAGRNGSGAAGSGPDLAPDDTGVYSIPLVPAVDATARIPLAARLVCIVGADQGHAFGIGKEPLLIGRGATDVNLHTSDVSRKHARVSKDEDGYVIEDLGSANGTFVNNTAIEGRTRLQIGDRIQVGSTMLALVLHDELEERMRQVQRLEAIAAAVGGLAHDFNNALQIILFGLDSLQHQLPDATDEVRATVQDITLAGGAAASLLKRILNLGRSDPPASDRVHVGQLLSETVAMTRRLLRDRISISTSVSPQAYLRGSRDEMQQVIVNLMLNARDAMPAGGTLTINAHVISLDAASALAHHLPFDRGANRSTATSYVELAITDTGIGMDEATLARVFDPFFTTKPPGEGTGLGLAMTHAIVQRHGGTVLVQSAPQCGTTFRVLIPAAE